MGGQNERCYVRGEGGRFHRQRFPTLQNNDAQHIFLIRFTQSKHLNDHHRPIQFNPADDNVVEQKNQTQLREHQNTLSDHHNSITTPKPPTLPHHNSYPKWIRATNKPIYEELCGHYLLRITNLCVHYVRAETRHTNDMRFCVIYQCSVTIEKRHDVDVSLGEPDAMKKTTSEWGGGQNGDKR